MNGGKGAKAAAKSLPSGAYVRKADGTVTQTTAEAGRFGEAPTYSGRKVKHAEVTVLAEGDGKVLFTARLAEMEQAATDASLDDDPEVRAARQRVAAAKRKKELLAQLAAEAAREEARRRCSRSRSTTRSRTSTSTRSTRSSRTTTRTSTSTRARTRASSGCACCATWPSKNTTLRRPSCRERVSRRAYISSHVFGGERASLFAALGHDAALFDAARDGTARR